MLDIQISIAHTMQLENIWHMQNIYCNVCLSRGEWAALVQCGSWKCFFSTQSSRYGFFPPCQSHLWLADWGI